MLLPQQLVAYDSYGVYEREEEVKTIKYEDPVKQYAYEQVVNKWGVEQWSYYKDLINRESGWNPTAQNPTSTAFGIHQFLNGTWQGGYCTKTSEYKVQIDCGIKYIEDRYEAPYYSIVFHNRNNWY